MVEEAVVNASPLILLSRAGHLGLLQVVARALLVPMEVVAEVRVKGDTDPTAQALAEAAWLRQVAVAKVPSTVASWRLGTGESAVLAAAHSRPGANVIVDDREARRCAAALGIPFFGTIGVVLRAKRAGAIPAARSVLEDLVQAGMYLREATLAEALGRVGE